MFVPECDGTSNIKVKSENGEIYAAVAVVGDQFWNKGKPGFGGKPEFSMAYALKRDYKTMNNTFHNIDHSRQIQDIVGTNINTEYDEKNKQMIIHIKPNKNMTAYHTWHSFLEMCRETRKIPNVSIEAYVECEEIKASDLPEGIDYQKYGIKDDDIVETEIGYRFVGTATVVMGACSDTDGCGIDLNSMNYSHTNDIWEYNYKNQETIKMSDEEKTEVEEEETKPENITEETPKEEEPIEDKPKDEKPVEENSDLVLNLKKRLVDCGETRTAIETERETLLSERTALEERIIMLEKTNTENQTAIDDLNEKLSKPVTKRQTTDTKETDWKINAVKTLMGRE